MQKRGKRVNIISAEMLKDWPSNRARECTNRLLNWEDSGTLQVLISDFILNNKNLNFLLFFLVSPFKVSSLFTDQKGFYRPNPERDHRSKYCEIIRM